MNLLYFEKCKIEKDKFWLEEQNQSQDPISLFVILYEVGYCSSQEGIVNIDHTDKAI